MHRTAFHGPNFRKTDELPPLSWFSQGELTAITVMKQMAKRGHAPADKSHRSLWIPVHPSWPIFHSRKVSTDIFCASGSLSPHSSMTTLGTQTTKEDKSSGKIRLHPKHKHKQGCFQIDSTTFIISTTAF